MRQVKTFSEYMNDESRVSLAEKEKINFEIDLIGKMVEARKERGLTQRELARISGVRQPVIARLEKMKTVPQIDTLFKILNSLGYTISIVPLSQK